MQFQLWFDEAKLRCGLKYANTMALATVNANAYPSVRHVLLKQVDVAGFQFFTNYESRKGKDLAANPNAALCFYWESLCYQVRVEGVVTRLSPELSDHYFQTRPRKSQLGAWASKQSSVIKSREDLENKVQELEQKYPQNIPRPIFWGGYLLKPNQFEFWIEKENRLHDRFQYTRKRNEEWLLQRLSP